METMTEIIDKQLDRGFVPKPLLDRVLNRLGITRSLGADLRFATSCWRGMHENRSCICIQVEREFYNDPNNNSRGYLFLEAVVAAAIKNKVGFRWGHHENTNQAFLILFNNTNN